MKSGQTVLNSLPDVSRATSDVEALLNSLGRIWVAGVQPNWKSFHKGERLHRVSLPTYPFERKRYWISPTKTDAAKAEAANADATTVVASPRVAEPQIPVYLEPQQSTISTIPIPQNASEPGISSPESAMAMPSSDLKESLMREQIRMMSDLMSRQLEMLRPSESTDFSG